MRRHLPLLLAMLLVAIFGAVAYLVVVHGGDSPARVTETSSSQPAQSSGAARVPAQESVPANHIAEIPAPDAPEAPRRVDSPSEEPPRSIEVDEAQPPEPLDNPKDFECSISGWVIDDVGNGIPGATVTAAARMRGDSGTVYRDIEGSWGADAEGAFTITIKLRAELAVSAMDVTVAARHPGMAPRQVEIVRMLKHGQSREKVTITLVPGGSISGYVRDDTGNPLADVVVTAVLRDGNTSGEARQGSIIGEDRSVRTDNAGRYHVPAAKEGVWHVMPLPGEHGIIKTVPTVTVTVGRETTAADIVLGRAVKIRVKLINEEGMPFAPSENQPLYCLVSTIVGGDTRTTAAEVKNDGYAEVRGVPLETTELVFKLHGVPNEPQSEPVPVAIVPGTVNDIGTVTLRSATKAE